MRREAPADCKPWSQFKKGDKNAFAELYRQNSASLISYGLKICSDEELLKDAIQDLFVELWNSRENLAVADCVQFYLFKALRYKLIRAGKQQQLRNPLSIVSAGHAFSKVAVSIESSIIDKEIQDSQATILRKAIETLSRRQQEVIQLRFYQGFSNEQIAAVMNMNYQSVSNLMYNALYRIKKSLKKPVFATALTLALRLFF